MCFRFYCKSKSINLFCTLSYISGEIEGHLQAMLNILPPQDNLTMAVRLQSAAVEDTSSINHARYLAVVSSARHREINFQNTREVVLLGLDCLPNSKVA